MGTRPPPQMQFPSGIRRRKLFVLCTLFLFVPGAQGQQKVITKVPDWAENRIFSWSSDHPMSTFVNNSQGVTSTTKLILGFVEHVEGAILKMLEKHKSFDVDDPLQPCNFDLKGWTNSILTFFFVRNWTQPDLGCITDLHGTRTVKTEQPLLTEDEVFEALQRRGDTLNAQVKPLADFIVGNWSNPDIVYNAQFSRLTQTCTLHPSFFMRIRGEWYMLLSITNPAKEAFAGPFTRQYISEYIGVGDNGKLVSPVRMTLEKRPDGPDVGEERKLVQSTTTSIESWRGIAVPSHVIQIYAEDNLAVADALDGLNLFVQQAEDAMTVSGIAILVLPLGFNLVPLALLTQVSTVPMLFYVLFSDVLTVIPLAIKGMELINIANKRVRRVVMRITSATNGTLAETSAAELWAAECRTQGNVGKAGIAFVVTAMVFLVIGICGEFVAYAFVKRRRRKRIRAIQEGLTGSGEKWDTEDPKMGDDVSAAVLRKRSGYEGMDEYEKDW